MEKISRIIFRTLQAIMLIIALFWLGASIFRLFQHSIKASVVLIIIGVLGLSFTPLFKRCFRFLMQHKLVLTLLVIIYQCVIMGVAYTFIRADAAVVFQGAFKVISESSIASYLTRNPNNMMLFLYERSFYNIFGFYAIYIMEALNIFYVNITAWILAWTCKTFINQKASDLVFTFYTLLMGFSPYFMAMYTDVIVLPMIACQVHLVMSILSQEEKNTKGMILLGLVTAIGVSFRPTLLIIIFALIAQLFLKGKFKKLTQLTLVFGLSFGIIYATLSDQKSHQNEVALIEGEGLAKNALTFINLGLTYSGSDQTDMKNGLLQYVEPSLRNKYNNGMFKNEYQVAEIRRRLAEYTPKTFTQHLLIKLGNTINDGTLGWLYIEDTEKEKTPTISPLYKFTENQAWAEALRQYLIYVDEFEYRLYRYAKQIIWITLSCGLVAAFINKKRNPNLQVLAIAILGGLLFLMLFEGGKARYLIQFLPQILVVASFGVMEIVTKIECYRRL